MNKNEVLLKKVQLLEREQDVKGALKLLKDVKLTFFGDNAYAIEEVEKRLKAKRELLKPKVKKKAKKQPKKKGVK